MLRKYPERIKESEEFIAGLEADMKTLAEHPHPIIVKETTVKADGQPPDKSEPPEGEALVNSAAAVTKGFAGMVIHGEMFTDKVEAGKMLIAEMRKAAELRSERKLLDPLMVGSYRGFSASLSVEDFGSTFVLTLKGQMTHRTELSEDVVGNFLRIDHALDKMPERITNLRTQVTNLQNQIKVLQGEIGKPFEQEKELQEKSARLMELNAQLGIEDGTAPPEPERQLASRARPSILDNLKRPLPPRQTEEGGKTKKQERER